MSHLGQFATLLKNGVARTNRFEVLIPLPGAIQGDTSNILQENATSFNAKDVLKLVGSFVGGGGNEVARGLNYMVEQTEIPGKNLTTTDVRYNGDFFKLPYSVVYGAQQFTFRVSRDMYEKNIIDDWMNSIFDPITHEISYMDDYVTDITINQLDEQDNVVHSIILKDAFPSMCNPLTVSNEESNQFHRLSVQFMYRRWKKPNEVNVTSGVSSLSQTPFGPLVAPILSNPAIQKGLEVFERETGFDLEGEAANIYNQVDDIVKSATGSSINKSVSLIEGIKASTEMNDRLTDLQKSEVLSVIDDAIGALRS